jgi:hypothetical protein
MGGPFQNEKFRQFSTSRSDLGGGIPNPLVADLVPLLCKGGGGDAVQALNSSVRKEEQFSLERDEQRAFGTRFSKISCLMRDSSQRVLQPLQQA